MKKLTTLWILIMMLAISVPAMGAMSISKMRQNARFLTDRMAYELRLNPQQYDDVYEVNYDFINNVRYLMDDVVRGYDNALDRYYDFLDVRNDDLRWVLSRTQYRQFMGLDYFYRPIYAQNNKWQFRVYINYTNINFFYFGKPRHYATYAGSHYRTHYNNVSYYQSHYRDRYHHDIYDGHYRIRQDKVAYDNHRHRDFGPSQRQPKKETRPTPPPSRPDRPRENHNESRPSRDNSRYQDNKRNENRSSSKRNSAADYRKDAKKEDKKSDDSHRRRER